MFRFEAGTADYTQLVWADTEELGCGLVYYEESDPQATRTPHRHLLVCNYAAAGNMISKDVYHILDV